ncbi:MAG: hypothetical protein GX538_01295 [Gammaproteobacteria bacterium]|nr:hypothetical protein [Gammaproteobacteria bacterium]
MTRFLSATVATLAAAAVLPGVAAAADARAGVHPRHGEMVLLRDVHARQAYRPMPPGVALIVDPTPNREIDRGLATGELSDADFAAMSTGHSLTGVRPQTSGIDAGVTSAINAGLGTGHMRPGTNAAGGTLTGPLGNVGATTRGIGSHVTGALSNLPFGKTGQGGP